MKRIVFVLILLFMTGTIAVAPTTVDLTKAQIRMITEAISGNPVALKRLLLEGNNGAIYAQLVLGDMAEHGKGVVQNYDTAARWYQKAADQGSFYAIAVLWYQKVLLIIFAISLIAVYKTHKSISDRKQENLTPVEPPILEPNSVGKIFRDAELGDRMAQCKLGSMYELGGEIKQDHEQAVNWYRKSAKKNYPIAQLNLGRMYEHGRGVTQNDAEAVGWYRKAAKQKNSNAQFNLGWMYQRGYGVERNYVESIYWYRKAVKQKHPYAQSALDTVIRQAEAEVIRIAQVAAENLERDKSVAAALAIAQAKAEAIRIAQVATENLERDKSAAAALAIVQANTIKNAEQGDVVAQLKLGKIHDYGQGTIQQDHTKAVFWYHESAKRGYAEAQLHLGRMYERGLGVEQNNTEAFRWCHEAAEQNNVEALRNLIWMYQNGCGVAQNSALAVEWQRRLRSIAAGVIIKRPNITLSSDSSGHYFIDGKINGVREVTFMIDTGATFVALPQSFAHNAKIQSTGKFITVNTANGNVQMMAANVKKLLIYPFEFNNVEVLISPHEDQALLGSNVLGQLNIHQLGGEMHISTH